MEALIIIDMQEGYIGKHRGSETFDNVLNHINFTANLFRKAGRPVFVVRDLSEGKESLYDNVTELDVFESDIEIIKYDNNSFWKTTLDEKLKQHDIDFLVLSGNAAEYCVVATYFGALERGYQTVILQHGVLSKTKSGLKTINKVYPLVSYTSLKYLLK